MVITQTDSEIRLDLLLGARAEIAPLWGENEEGDQTIQLSQVKSSGLR